MTKNTRLNVRLDPKLARQVKAYAKRNSVTVSSLIEKHLKELLVQERQLEVVATTGDAEQV